MSERLERRPVRIVLSNGEIRYEVRAASYLNGKRKRLRRRFRTVVEAEEFIAETPESDRLRRYKIRDEQYRKAVMQSRSIAGALRLLGVAPEGGNYRVCTEPSSGSISIRHTLPGNPGHEARRFLAVCDR
jgi:hypothetical protein